MQTPCHADATVAKLFIPTCSFFQTMPASGKVLEDSIRLSRIRKIKMTLYVVQAIMLVILGMFLIFVVGGAMLKPYLYIPIDSFLAVVVLLLLIISLESFFFRILEIKFARSSSARHLMAMRSMKRAIIVAILTGILATVASVPPILGALEDAAEKTVDVSPSEAPMFYSSDTFALVSSKRVDVVAPRQVEIYLMDDDIFNQYYGLPEQEFLVAMKSYRLNTDDFIVLPGATLSLNVPSQGFMRYHLVLNDYDNGTSAKATIVKETSSTFTGIVSLLLISFVVANVAWFAYLIPIERKYSSGSIYK